MKLFNRFIAWFMESCEDKPEPKTPPNYHSVLERSRKLNERMDRENAEFEAKYNNREN